MSFVLIEILLFRIQGLLLFYIIILDSSVPSRKERAFESLSGEDQSCGEDGAMASLCSNGRCLKLHHGDAEVFPGRGEYTDGYAAVAEMATSAAWW